MSSGDTSARRGDSNVVMVSRSFLAAAWMSIWTSPSSREEEERCEEHWLMLSMDDIVESMDEMEGRGGIMEVSSS